MGRPVEQQRLNGGTLHEGFAGCAGGGRAGSDRSEC